ncbi:uncharacterized protein LOC142166584 [Nicotiana tabacum]|uniref:Uncharacterized protein LOC142166584 n=1 Tax=Nicotiana tabacum TaxID=4097 RepID=A0AC58SAS1_TOBAC
MQCPNCRTVEDGNWLLFLDSEDEESEEQQNNEIEVSDSDDDDEEYDDDEPLSPEDQLDFLEWMKESDNNPGPIITRQENLDPSGQTFLIQGSTLHFENDGRTTFSSTTAVGSVGSVSMSYEPPPPPPPPYEQTCCNPLPSLELTLAISTSVDVEHQLPCYCHRCRPSTSRRC